MSEAKTHPQQRVLDSLIEQAGGKSVELTLTLPGVQVQGTVRRYEVPGIFIMTAQTQGGAGVDLYFSAEAVGLVQVARKEPLVKAGGGGIITV